MTVRRWRRGSESCASKVCRTSSCARASRGLSEPPDRLAPQVGGDHSQPGGLGAASRGRCLAPSDAPRQRGDHRAPGTPGTPGTPGGHREAGDVADATRRPSRWTGMRSASSKRCAMLWLVSSTTLHPKSRSMSILPSASIPPVYIAVRLVRASSGAPVGGLPWSIRGERMKRDTRCDVLVVSREKGFLKARDVDASASVGLTHCSVSGDGCFASGPGAAGRSRLRQARRRAVEPAYCPRDNNSGTTRRRHRRPLSRRARSRGRRDGHSVSRA